MFNIGMPEMVIILVVILIIFGPRRIPEIARSIGRALNEFRRSAEDIKNEMTRELLNAKKDLEDDKRVDEGEQRGG